MSKRLSKKKRWKYIEDELKNKYSIMKEKQLTESYKQKYIVKENQLIYFLKIKIFEYGF